MTLLSASQLTTIRAQATASLDRTCTLRTVTLGASDSAGGFGADSTSDASVACRVALPSGRDRAIADRAGVEADTVITLAHSQTVTETQRIVDASTGKTYEVVLVNSEDSYRTATRVYAKRLA